MFVYSKVCGAPGRIRTCDARLFKAALYPLSYRSLCLVPAPRFELGTYRLQGDCCCQLSYTGVVVRGVSD